MPTPGHTQSITTISAVLLAALTLTACGSTHDKVVARIASTAITAATVQHWAAVLAAERSPTHQQAQRRNALSLLFRWQWLEKESHNRDVQASGREVQARVRASEGIPLSARESEVRELLKTIGQTPADAEREARASLDAAGLRESVLNRVPAATEAQIAAFYNEHKQQFALPERRDLLITNRKSAAKAAAVKRELEAGTPLTTLLIPETIRLSHTIKAFEPTSFLEVAIWRSKPHVLVGPVRRRVDYFTFVVEKIIPAGYQTLAQARGAIRRRLDWERAKQALIAAVRAWRSRWTAKTICAPEYLVQGCSNYAGPVSAEDPLAFG